MHAEAKKIDWKAKLLSQEQQLQSITKGETIFYKKKRDKHNVLIFISVFRFHNIQCSTTNCMGAI